MSYALESCARRVNPHGLQVPAFAGWVWEPALLCVRVELAARWGGSRLNLLRVRGEPRMRNSSCG